MRRLVAGCVVFWFVSGTAFGDLSAVKAEPNLQKRSKKALENAEVVLARAKDEYRSNEFDKSRAALEEVAVSVDLAYDSLKQTGKTPAKSPGQFKYAETKTRTLLRQLEDFRHEMDTTDHALLDKVKAAVQKVHDELLLGILERKK